MMIIKTLHNQLSTASALKNYLFGIVVH